MSSVDGRTFPERIIGSRFSAWLDKRVPPSPQITLSQRNIFIFPTRTGFVFSGLLLLLILGAVNYQASLVYAVAFLLGSLFLVTILYTFQNLSGLQLELVNARPGFVGEDLEFTVRVVRPQGKSREGIQLGWPSGIMQWAELLDKEADTVRLYVEAQRRGYQDPGRLLVETYFPLGLLRAWTWVDLNARALGWRHAFTGANLAIRAWLHTPDAVETNFVGAGGVLDASVCIGSDDFGAWNNGAAVIGNYALNGARCLGHS